MKKKRIFCHKKLIMQNYVQIKIILRNFNSALLEGKREEMRKRKGSDIKSDSNLFFASLMERL